MSSLAYGLQAARERSRGRRRGRWLSSVLADHGSDVLLGVVVAVFGIILLADVPKDYNVDSWLALVDGRLVWQSGIPHRDLMNAISFGHRWTDEQWLSQLASYAIYRVGGLGLLGAVNVALILGSVGAAVAAARRRGAPFRSVLLTIPMCVALISPSREIRTQEFAMPLFMATVCLLSADSRARSRRVFWCIPILALWANVHGSATQGAGLVVLYALTVLWQRRASLLHDARAWRRPVALALGALAAILITPYGLHIIGYYHTTMVSSTLRQFVSEWQPVTSSTPSTVALALLVGLALWSFGRNPSATTMWEKLALLVLAAGTVEVVRNALFLGLLGLIVVPLSLAYGAPADASQSTDAGSRRADAGRHADAGMRMRVRINGALAALAALGLVAGAAVVIALPNSTVQDAKQSPRMAAAVQRAVATDPSLKVIADDRYSDYLLWRDPGLAGHIAADVRFELLTTPELSRLEAVFTAAGPDFAQGARGYRLLVLNRTVDADGVKAFLAEPGVRVLYRDHSRIVILRSAAEAQRG